MARRKQQHLGEVIRAAGGTSTVNTEVTALVARGIVLLRAERDAARLAERGTLVQQNPYVSDAGKCQRALAYKLMAIPESDPMTLDSLINIMTGEALEEWFATVLAAAIGGVVRQQRDVAIEHIQQMVLDGAIYPERCDECYEKKAECICDRICKWCGTTDCDEPECAERIAEGAVL